MAGLLLVVLRIARLTIVTQLEVLTEINMLEGWLVQPGVTKKSPTVIQIVK